MASAISIGRLARQTGCKVQTIRYYEAIGLLPVPRRTAGNQRVYDAAHVDRLTFIRRGRELGFSIDQIRELLDLSRDAAEPCERIDGVARRHLGEIDEKIARLTALRRELEHVVDACAGRSVASCRVVEALTHR